VQCLKYSYLVAQASEVACAGQTGRACTNDGNLVTVGRRFYRLLGAVFARVVGNKALQTADGYRLALDAAHAVTLTLALLRAHTAADRRKCGGFCDYLCGFLVVAFLNLFDKARNVDGNGTSAHALRILAL